MVLQRTYLIKMLLDKYFHALHVKNNGTATDEELRTVDLFNEVLKGFDSTLTSEQRKRLITPERMQITVYIHGVWATLKYYNLPYDEVRQFKRA